MKILSWVHRQFLHKPAKKDDDYDKVALLETEAFASACYGWNDGILLAIGTLGVDLFQDLEAKEDTKFMNSQVLFLDDDDGDDDHDHEEEMEIRSLVRKVSNHAFDHVEKKSLSPCDKVAKPSNHQEDDVVVVKDLTKDKKSGERTTLADLLRVDSENNLFKNDELSESKSDSNSNSNSNSDILTNNESIKSLLVSKVKNKFGKDGSAPPMIKKTKQLMRKILRKKIHPDIWNQKESQSIVGHVHAT